mmetsp:Transcript_35611/g.72584  ORF Transcript_35611/g.72584 Transcript_35611/m.72584 type:complete len:160 (+) Transcript_35611:89-568(+)
MSAIAREVIVATTACVAGGFLAWLYFSNNKKLRLVDTPTASPAGGHYSQAVIHGGLVYVSGLLPVTPMGEKLNNDSFELQTTMVLSNLKAILKASGSSLQNVISVRVYIADIEQWGAFNKIYVRAFESHKPARAVVPVPCLHYGFQLEVEAVAALHSLY